MICALDNKPEVRAEIQSLADKIGEDYATARIIYETNNGYSLDKAPNGAESKLYKDLLEYYGNETLALKTKAKTYLKPFLNWFGDWTGVASEIENEVAIPFSPFDEPVTDKNSNNQKETSSDVSKAVDKNGEPLIVYHGSNTKTFDALDFSKSDDGISFFTTSDRHVANTYIQNMSIEGYPEDVPEFYQFGFIHHDQEINAFAIPHMNEFYQFAEGEFNGIPDYTDTIDNELWVKLLYNFLDQIENIEADLYLSGKEKAKKLSYYGIYDEDQLRLTKQKIRNDIKFYNKPENNFSVTLHDKQDYIYPLFFKSKNPLIISREYGATKWHSVEVKNVPGIKDGYYKTRELTRLAKSKGYDSVIIEKVVDSGPFGTQEDDYYTESVQKADGTESRMRLRHSTLYVAVDSENQIKSIDNKGTFSTTDNRIHYYNPLYDASDSVYTLSDSVIEDLTTYPAEGDYTAKDFMQRMLTSGELFNDPVQQQIALKLFEKGLKGATVVFSNDSNYWMKYSNGVITISLKSFGLNPYEFGHRFMHEVAHHYTEVECEEGGALHDIIKQLRENIEQHVSEEEKKDKLFYGLTDNHEFASEIYTNPFFRDEVVKRHAPKLWRKLLSNIFKFFGLNKLANKINVTPEYLMNELSKVIDNVTGNPLTDQLVGDHVHYYAPQVLDEIKKQATKEAEKVRKGLNTRLKSLKGALKQDPVRVAQLQNQIREYDDLLTRGEVQELIVDFIKTSNPLYNAILGKMRRAAMDPATITNDELLQIKNDFIDFYGPELNEFRETFFTNGYFDNLNPSQKINIARNLQLLERANTEIQSKWKQLVKVKAAEILRAHAEAQGRPTEMIDKYINDELNQTDSDINFYARFIQSAGRITDMTMSTMHRVMNDCDTEVYRYANQVVQDLKEVASHVKRSDVQALFEKDEKGRTTGRLIRPLNYGQFNQDYKKFMTSLDSKHGVTDGNVAALPDDEYIEYHREKENWLCEHCHRKFNENYYKAYAELSYATKQTLSEINQEIKRITDKVISPTGAQLEKLSDADYARLNNLYKYKRNLANKYDEYGNIKFGDDLKIAEELSAFNAKISQGLGRVTYTQQQIKDLIKRKESELTKEEFEKWHARNVSVVYSQAFSDDLGRLAKRDYGQRYAELQEEKNTLLRYGRDTRSPYVDAAKLSFSVRERIREIDLEQAMIREQNQNANQSSGLLFKDVAKTELTARYKKDKADALARGKAYYDKWFNDNHVDGHPASYYTKLIPLKQEDLEFRLNPMNQELSADSPLMNPNFNFDQTETRQPKKEHYDNQEAYDKATNTPEKQNLYDAIVQVMSEANSKLTWLDNSSPYYLPQITGDKIDYIIRSKRNVFGALKDYYKDAMQIRPDDVGFALNNFAEKPRGGRIDFVPHYYTTELDNTDYISRNLIGIVSEYARMAENYRVKREHQADFMLIDEILKDRDVLTKEGDVKKEGQNTNLYKKYGSMLNMRLYGRFYNAPEWNFGIFKMRAPVKIWKNAIEYATKLGLGWSRNSIIKSFFQSNIRTLTEWIGGRYFDSMDMISAIGQQIMYIPKWLMQLGNPYANDFSIALMQHLNITREFGDTITDLQYSRPFRLFSKYGVMGGWSLIDYFIKTPVIKAIAANFRLDPTSGKFMPRYKFINTYYADNKKEGNKAFNQLKTKWLNVVTSKNGKIVPKPGYEYLSDVIFDKNTQNLLKSVSEFVTNRIDGKISESDKQQWMTSMLGSAACMHRWYYIFNLDDNFASLYQYNPMIEDYYEARFQSVAKIMWKAAQNIGILTKNMFGANKEYKKVTPTAWYNLRRTVGQLGLIIATTLLMARFIEPWFNKTDNHIDDAATVAMYGAISEEYSEYPTITPKKNTLIPEMPLLTQLWSGDMGSTFSPAWNSMNALGTSLFTPVNWKYNYFGPRYSSGDYRGMTVGMRNHIRAIPGLKGLWEAPVDKNDMRYTYKKMPWVIKQVRKAARPQKQDFESKKQQDSSKNQRVENLLQQVQ